jgi:uncharacterized protein (DUF1800 family)
VPISYDDAAHLLRRAGFGGTAGEIAALTAYDVNGAVDRVLDLSAAPPVVAPAALADPSLGQWQKVVALTQWWVDRMRTTPAPLQEKLALFWHGHFCSSEEKVGNALAMWNQNQLFRTQGLGSFRALAQAVAVDPAMLRYLDNDQNVAGRAQENFARESMELFTLGVNQYTQDDVVAAAKAWTGHTTDSTGTVYVFNAAKHDTTNKTFFGVTQNWNGPQVLDHILQGPTRATAARFVAAKAWSFFAYPNPEPAVLDALVTAFTANDLLMTDLLRAVFTHPNFWSTAARQGLARSPAEYVVAVLRATGADAATAHPEWFMDDMGQSLFYPPNVSGWRQNAYWISSSALWARASFARSLTWKLQAGPLFANVSTLPVATAVQQALDTFGITNPSAQTRAALETWLQAERTARGWAQRPNLTTLMMLIPELQVA